MGRGFIALRGSTPTCAKELALRWAVSAASTLSATNSVRMDRECDPGLGGFMLIGAH
jgi:hypothetical protein